MTSDARVHVEPGEGGVGRYGPVVVLLVGPLEPPIRGLLDLLSRLGRLGDDLDPADLSRRTLEFIARSAADLPPFGVVTRAGDDLTLVLHGDVVCRVRRAGEEIVHSGRDAALALNVVVTGPYERVSLAPLGTELGAVRVRYDLGGGLVPAGAVVIVSTSDEAPGPAVVHMDVADDASDEPQTDVMSVASDEPETDGLVDGIACPAGHFNHPFALECARCGVSLLDSPRTTVRGFRAPLGRLTFDDGTSYPLDQDYVIGREPEHDAAVVAEDASPLRLQDPQGQISRVHAEVRSVGWEVHVIDRGSVNGTQVLSPEAKTWRRLDPDEPWPISPGTRVSMGRRIMTYDR